MKRLKSYFRCIAVMVESAPECANIKLSLEDRILC
uniref:Uncharacterized protein n=1 Tax=Anguilla anguilla TaxID=7936 RepID=A0A0E9VT52_ANGAN